MNSTDLTPRFEHTLACGHKHVSSVRLHVVRCAWDETTQDVTEVHRFHINADGYRRGPHEQVA